MRERLTNNVRFTLSTSCPTFDSFRYFPSSTFNSFPPSEKSLMAIATFVKCHLQIGHLFFLSATFWGFHMYTRWQLASPSSRSIWSHVSCTMYLSITCSVFPCSLWKVLKAIEFQASPWMEEQHCPLSILRMTNSLTCKLQTNAPRPSTRGNFLHGARHQS